MDINQALIYYGSDKAKEDFLMQQEAEKNKRKLQAIGGRNESLAAGEYMRNTSEFRQQRPILSAAGDGTPNMFIPAIGTDGTFGPTSAE